jgi:hypothetical protein
MAKKVIIRCSKTCPCGEDHKKIMRGETAVILRDNVTREGEVDLEIASGRLAGRYQTCPRGCLQPVAAVEASMTPPKPAPPCVGVSYSNKGYGTACDRCGSAIGEEHTAECMLASGVSPETVKEVLAKHGQ